MAAVRDDFSGGKENVKNLKEEYAKFINSDAGLVEARRWIERATFTPFKNDDFRESLADGVLLCELIVNVASISVGRINRSATPYSGKDNLTVFFRACEALGLEPSQLFEMSDLQEVPMRRGQSIIMQGDYMERNTTMKIERARESQKRLRKVAITIYWLGKYAKGLPNYTGGPQLDEPCFAHLFQESLPPLPELEGAVTRRRSSQFEAENQLQREKVERKQSIPDKDKIVIEKVDFKVKREAFRQLEEQTRKEQAAELQRRKSFSSVDPQNQWIEEAKQRRKSIGNKPVFKEGDCKFKHKKEILGGWKDPLHRRRERIEKARVESETTETKPPVTIPMRSPGDLKDKKQRYEQMERQATEEADVLQGKRVRPKSWAEGDFKHRGASLKDKTSKFEDLQYQADRQSAVLRGTVRQPSTELYDIGDQPSRVISLPSGSDIKLRDKKKQFEHLDYKAQRESSILVKHSGKSFDTTLEEPRSLNTAARRSDPKPRPKSDIYEYPRYHNFQEPEPSYWQRDGDVEMDSIDSKAYDMEIREEAVNPVSSYQQESGRDFLTYTERHGERSPARSISPTPNPPTRGTSLMYNAVSYQRKYTDEKGSKDTKPKTEQYSSFTAATTTDASKENKAPEMRYKDFVVPPVTKQRERVDRYTSAVDELSKEPEPKNIDFTTAPRRKSRTSTEWIKVTATEEPTDPIPKQSIKKLWDREPEPEEPEADYVRIRRYEKPSVDISSSSIVPNVRNMSYRDFSASPSKPKDDVEIMRTSVVETHAEPQRRRKSEPEFKRFTAPVIEPSRGGKATSLTYKDFAVPPPKVNPAAHVQHREPVSVSMRKQKVRDLSKMFTNIETEQLHPKPRGPPQPKSLVDRDELVRQERESRARSWYGGPLGIDDDDYDIAYRGRVRRWSDDDYDERHRTRYTANEPEPSYYQQQHKSEPKPQAQEYSEKYDYKLEPYVASHDDQPYAKPTESEIKPAIKAAVESRRESGDFDEDRLQSSSRDVEPESNVMKPDSDFHNREPKPYNTQSLKSILKHEPETDYSNARPASPDSEAKVDYPHIDSKKDDSLPTQKPITVTPWSLNTEEKPKSNTEPYYSSRVSDSTSGSSEQEAPARPPMPQYRAIGGRSWQDFDSSRRKKSEELLNRPAIRGYEPVADQEKSDVDAVKLRRPADYIKKRYGNSAKATAPKAREQPSYEQPRPLDDRNQYYYESLPSAQERYPETRREEAPKYTNGQDGLPVSYPTYYEPEEEIPEPRGRKDDIQVTVETGMPLLVNAKLRDEKEEPEPETRTPNDQSYDFIVAEKQRYAESQPDVQSFPPSTHHFRPDEEPRKGMEVHEPKQPDVEELYTWQPKLRDYHTWQPEPLAREPDVERHPAQEKEIPRHLSKESEDRDRDQLQRYFDATEAEIHNAKEPEVQKHYSNKPEVEPPQKQPPRTSQRPQVFAIVGQTRQVRPVVSEIPKPMSISLRKEETSPSSQSSEEGSYQESHENDLVPSRTVEQAVHDVSVMTEEELREEEELRLRKAKTFDFRDSNEKPFGHSDPDVRARNEPREEPKHEELTEVAPAPKEEPKKQETEQPAKSKEKMISPLSGAKIFDFRNESPPAGKEIKTTVTEAAQPYRDVTEAARPYRDVTEAAQPYGDVTEAAQPYRDATEAAQPYRDVTEAAQPYRDVTEAAQPYGDVTEAAQPYRDATEAAQPYRDVTEAAQPYRNATEAAQPYRDVDKKEPLVTRKQMVVVETIDRVEKEPAKNEDVFKVLEDEHREEEAEQENRNIRDPEYRAKLRKEIEETNRKQREDARYLMNLQMRQSLGSEEDESIQKEQERLKQEQQMALQQADKTIEPLHGLLYEMDDYNTRKREDEHTQRPNMRSHDEDLVNLVKEEEEYWKKANDNERQRIEVINGDFDRRDERPREINGTFPTEDKGRHHYEHHVSDLDNEEKIRRLNADQQHMTQEKDRNMNEARIRQIKSKKGTFFVIGQQQVRRDDHRHEQQRYSSEESRKHAPREHESQWKSINDGSNYGIYEAYIHGDRSHVVCASCGAPIRKSVAMYVTEMNRYWHDHCFQCVVCHARFGSSEQHSPMKVTSSLLHCENCFITDEGERCTEV